MHRVASTCALLVAILLTIASSAFAVTYVKWDSPGPTLDGTSWDTAFHTVQQGLNASTPADEVWVASGTYVGTITLVDGVGLYGGFSGTETERVMRTPEANVTTLDGNRIGSVVMSPAGAASTTVIDGFTITNGIGTGGANPPGGGGIFCHNSSPLIQNCVVTGNCAGDGGTGGGGGIRCQNGASPTIRNCIIRRNTAGYGGGVSLYQASATLVNCLIADNVSTSTYPWYGGGGILNNSSTCTLANCTIAGNRASNGGGIHNRYEGAVLTMTNCIVWGNTASSWPGQYNESPAVFQATYCDIQMGPAGVGNLDGNPIFLDQPGGDYRLRSTSPCVDTGRAEGMPADDLQGVVRPQGDGFDIGCYELAAGGVVRTLVIRTEPEALGTIAPAEGTHFYYQGDSVTVTVTPPTGYVFSRWEGDLSGGDNPAAVVMDADKSVTAVFEPSTVLYVKQGADGTGDGSSWQNAFPTIAPAVSAASGAGGAEIWVAEGTYAEGIGGNSRAYLYGGFAGDETARGQRDWIANETTVSMGTSGSARIDGFTILAGGSPHAVNCGSGGSPVIVNSRIGFGGGATGYSLFCDNRAAPRLIRCALSGQTICRNYSTPVLDGCVLRGTVVSETYSTPTITGCTLWAQALSPNTGQRGVWCRTNGGANLLRSMIYGCSVGVYAETGTGATIRNSIFASNLAGIDTRGSAEIVNNTVSGCTSAGIRRPDSGVVANNIVAFNGVGLVGSGTSLLSHNDVYGNTTNYSGVTPGEGDISADPGFVCQYWGNFHIRANSPCIAQGAAAYMLPDDIDGNLRLGARPDIGADESNGAVWGCAPRVIYVNPASAREDGTSWETAYHRISTATADACFGALGGGAGIWVAGGTYTEESYSVAPYACLYGGFAGTETDLMQRDLRANATILRGFCNLPMGTGISRLDGFTVDGSALPGPTQYTGVSCAASAAVITGNVIRNWTGTGLSIGSGIGAATPVISNNFVYSNYDGIMVNFGMACVTNNAIAGNTHYGMSLLSASPSVSNNIIACNTVGGVYASGGAPVLRNNDVYRNSSDYIGIGRGTGDIALDPQLANLFSFDLHIRPTSPCRDAGSSDVCGLPSVDIDGQTRPEGTSVDIGADESYGEERSGVVPVRYDSPNDGPGNDWNHAWRTITLAMYRALPGDELWVARGTYMGQVTLKAGVSMYGGFAGTEIARDQRDWAANLTVLDGNRSGSVVAVSAGATTSTRIDGFTIRNGAYGGGVTCVDASPTIANNTITGNSASMGGGVHIRCLSPGAAVAPVVLNNRIEGNTANGDGGGIFCFVSAPAITGNTIRGNTAGRHGGGIISANSSPGIFGNAIEDNSATNNGGGILCANSLPGIVGVIAGNTIARNSSAAGGGLYCSGSSPIVTGNTIVGNSAVLEGGGIECSTTSPTVANCVIAFNSSGIRLVSGAPVLRNNDVFGNTAYDYSGVSPGTGDLALDPLFADRASGNYHIKIASPCVNAGWTDAPGLPATDMDGEPRIIYGAPDIGADECSGTAQVLREVRMVADGIPVALSGAVVTAVFDGFFYIEAEDRSCGIRVDKADHGIQAGDKINTTGTLKTNAEGERYIEASSVEKTGTGSIAPMHISPKALGGGNWFYNPSTGAGQCGVVGGAGLNNIGLLVRTWGKISYIAGTSVLDLGVDRTAKILTEGMSFSGKDLYVRITGISSCYKDTDGLHSTIRVVDVTPL